MRTHNIPHVKENWKNIPNISPDLVLLLTLISSELPLSRTYFRGPKGVRAIEVLLY